MTKPVQTALVGICGGIAAYKAVDVVSRLRKAGWKVHVAMSDAAQKFVTALTFAAVSGNPVLETLFPSPGAHGGDELYPHLYPATNADLFILLPATADMIGRVANGLGSDVVSTSALSLPSHCRRFFCPAMNVEMWNQPVVKANVARLERDGWARIGPNAGALACGMEGEGRMAEPQEIVEAILQEMESAQALRGKKVLVISGPTREHIDPVRFIGNPSTGKMGKALAEEAVASGADVEFVTGPVAEVNLPHRDHLKIHHVTSAEDMLKKAKALYGGADVVIYAAAVADYKPVERHEKKLPKKSGDITLQLTATPDVAATLNEKKRKGQVAIGFALQTHDGVEKARAKLEKKHLDGIVLNSLEALGGDTGTYTYLSAANGRPAALEEWGKLEKRACARKILAQAIKALEH